MQLKNGFFHMGRVLCASVGPRMSGGSGCCLSNKTGARVAPLALCLLSLVPSHAEQLLSSRIRTFTVSEPDQTGTDPSFAFCPPAQ